MHKINQTMFILKFTPGKFCDAPILFLHRESLEIIVFAA